jgi:hypothetical protein
MQKASLRFHRIAGMNLTVGLGARGELDFSATGLLLFPLEFMGTAEVRLSAGHTSAILAHVFGPGRQFINQSDILFYIFLAPLAKGLLFQFLAHDETLSIFSAQIKGWFHPRSRAWDKLSPRGKVKVDFRRPCKFAPVRLYVATTGEEPMILC